MKKLTITLYIVILALLGYLYLIEVDSNRSLYDVPQLHFDNDPLTLYKLVPVRYGFIDNEIITTGYINHQKGVSYRFDHGTVFNFIIGDKINLGEFITVGENPVISDFEGFVVGMIRENDYIYINVILISDIVIKMHLSAKDYNQFDFERAFDIYIQGTRVILNYHEIVYDPLTESYTIIFHIPNINDFLFDGEIIQIRQINNDRKSGKFVPNSILINEVMYNHFQIKVYNLNENNIYDKTIEVIYKGNNFSIINNQDLEYFEYILIEN